MGHFIEVISGELDRVVKERGWSADQEAYAYAPLNGAAKDAGLSFVLDPVSSVVSVVSGNPEGNAEKVFYQSAYDRSVVLRPDPIPPGWDSWLLLLASHIDKAIGENERAWLNSIPGLVAGTAEASATQVQAAAKKAADIASGSSGKWVVAGAAALAFLLWGRK